MPPEKSNVLCLERVIKGTRKTQMYGEKRRESCKYYWRAKCVVLGSCRLSQMPSKANLNAVQPRALSLPYASDEVAVDVPLPRIAEGHYSQKKGERK